MSGTVAVVDDSELIRRMLEYALKSKGYSVVVAEDGLEALELLARTPCDLVLLDINMPRMDGLSVIKALRESEEWADLPIIVLTAASELTDRDRAMELGATDYMLKPFKPSELLARVAPYLEESE